MKKFFAIITLSVAALSFVLAGPGGTDVGLVSIKIIPNAKLYSAQAWATGTVYTAGMYVKSGPIYFMCVIGGTSGTDEPVGVGDVTDNTVTWRACLGRKRQGLSLSNNSTTEAVYISLKGLAVVNRGIRLNKDGGSIILTGDDAPQGEITAISPAATNNVTSMDW